MEKSTAYILIILAAVVVYGFSQSYTGQIARSAGQEIYEAMPAPSLPSREGVNPIYNEQTQFVARIPSRKYIPAEPQSRSTLRITANSTNHTSCISNTCVVVSGPGTNQCWPPGSLCGTSAVPAPLFQPGCTDTDTSNYPTINYFVRGTATVTFNNGFQTSQTDFCNFTLGSNTLQERFCTSAIAQFISSNTVNCNQFNMTCSIGRCV